MNDGYSQLKGMQYDSDSDDSSDYGMDVKDLAKGLADARKESKVNTEILCENWLTASSYSLGRAFSAREIFSTLLLSPSYGIPAIKSQSGTCLLCSLWPCNKGISLTLDISSWI